MVRHQAILSLSFYLFVSLALALPRPTGLDWSIDVTQRSGSLLLPQAGVPVHPMDPTGTEGESHAVGKLSESRPTGGSTDLVERWPDSDSYITEADSGCISGLHTATDAESVECHGQYSNTERNIINPDLGNSDLHNSNEGFRSLGLSDFSKAGPI